MEQSGRHIGGTLALHHRRLGTDGGGLRQEGVTIKPLAHQRHKHLARSQLAAVGADGSKRRCRIERALAPLRFSPAGDQVTKLHQIRAEVAR
jgi:hypothetical protein